MMVIKIVESRQDQKAFIMLPFELYKNNSYWIPPLISDEYKIFNIKTNPAMHYCDSCFWIAQENGKTIGRIVAIINHKYNEKVGEKLGRF